MCNVLLSSKDCAATAGRTEDMSSVRSTGIIGARHELKKQLRTFLQP